MATDIQFNNFNLNDSNFVTNNITHLSMPQRKVYSADYSRRHGGKLISDFYTQKIINIKGYIIADSELDRDTYINNALRDLSVQAQALDIGLKNNTETHRYICTATKLDIVKEPTWLTYARFDIDFLCLTPFSRSTSTTTDSEAGFTTSPKSKELTIGGSAEIYPVITITVNSETGLTVIKFETDITGDYVSITPESGYSASDVVVIDCENKSVTINASAVEYTGIFPRFMPGSTTWTVTSTSTAHDLDCDVEYYTQYLN